MLDWIKSTMDSLGYTGLVFLMFLENIFPPIPSEVVMPLAGFMTEQGELSFIGVVIAGMLGSVLGALPFYYLGKYVGLEPLRRWADRHGKWLTLSAKDVDKADAWFDTHGNKAVFFCRFVPGVRTLISVPAGFSGMPLIPFLLYTALGTGLWAALLAYLGKLLGENYDRVQNYIGPISYVVIGGLLVLAVVWVIKRRRNRR